MADDPTLRLSDHIENLPDWPRLWFSKGDGDALKQKVNGLSIGLDYIKLGLTPVKADVTGFKVDEKGISFFGITLKEWPWVQASSWKNIWMGKKARAEEQKKKDEAAQEKEAAEILSRNLRQAHRRIDGLESRLSSQRGRVDGVAAGPNAASGNPKNIKSAAMQIKELEARLNSLMAALG